MKKKSKYLCAHCLAETQIMLKPVRSSVLKKWFCDLNCFNKYKEENKSRKNR